MRRVAAELVDGVLRRHKPLDEALEGPDAHGVLRQLNRRDRAFVTMLSQTTLRRLGSLRAVLAQKLQSPLPRRAGMCEAILLTGAAQILFMETASHAAVDQSVRLAAADRNARHFRGLVNAVLRRIADDGPALLDDIDQVAADTPDWLMARWSEQYGTDVARAIAAAHGQPPPLDLTVRSEPDVWAERLSAVLLPTGSVRLDRPGAVERLDGYDDGAWWVQDAAAALPVRLLGDVAGLSVGDLAAAPGGKTAQLAAAGARVTAVDRSPKRLERLAENLARLDLSAETVTADLGTWQPGKPFDVIILDAPCSATGTIRRHPDIPWLRRPDDIAALAARQTAMLTRALDWLKPGGRLVYAVCSLEREEGEDVVAAAVGSRDDVRVDPLAIDELPGLSGAVTQTGFLRTRPDMAFCGSDGIRAPGMDGFFAVRLIRT